jgi:hypothetical protein
MVQLWVANREGWQSSLCRSNTRVHVHNGQVTRFWTSSWLNGTSLESLFPVLYKHSKRKNRSVAEAMESEFYQRHNAQGHGRFINTICVIVGLSRSSRFQPSWPRSRWDSLDQSLRWKVIGKVSLWHAVWRQHRVLLNLGMESLGPLVMQIFPLADVTKYNLDSWPVTNEGIAESIFLSALSLKFENGVPPLLWLSNSTWSVDTNWTFEQLSSLWSTKMGTRLTDYWVVQKSCGFFLYGKGKRSLDTSNPGMLVHLVRAGHKTTFGFSWFTHSWVITFCS